MKSEIQGLFNNYLNKLTIVDDFWETHILDGEFYSIQGEEKIVGFFSIFKKTKITSFYLLDSQIKEAQKIFSDIISKFGIGSAFVATSDELLLSLAMDYHQKVEMQAYFFTDSKTNAKEANWQRNLLSLATETDIPEIMATEPYDDIEALVQSNAVYVMRKEDSTFLGTGIINPLKSMPNICAIGMSVSKQYRQLGIGRSILTYLKNLCYGSGKTPVAGCWYQNANSKKTLESAGFITKSRLLNILF
jgi:hypothetical protein